MGDGPDWSADSQLPNIFNVTVGLITTSTSPTGSNNELDVPGGSSATVLTVFLGIVYALIILVSFVGNFMVIVSVLSTHKLKTTTNYLLMALAVADLTVTVGEFGR